MGVHPHPEASFSLQEVVMDKKRPRISLPKMNISGVAMYSGLTLPLKSRNNTVKSVKSSPNVIAVNETVVGFDFSTSGTKCLPTNKVKKLYE